MVLGDTHREDWKTDASVEATPLEIRRMRVAASDRAG